jgi:hypothetical protein
VGKFDVVLFYSFLNTLLLGGASRLIYRCAAVSAKRFRRRESFSISVSFFVEWRSYDIARYSGKSGSGARGGI